MSEPNTTDAPATEGCARAAGSGPELLEEGEAWCSECQRMSYQLGPWEESCPCGALYSRTGYGTGEDDPDPAEDEAQNNPVQEREASPGTPGSTL